MKPYRSDKYLDWIRTLPCAKCGDDSSMVQRAAHHLLRGVVRGMGMRAGDDRAIPLCQPCHQGPGGVHDSGDEILFLGSMDGPRLAGLLFENQYDTEEAYRILGDPPRRE